MQRIWSPKADLIIKNVKIYTVALTIKEIKAGKTEFPVYENGFVAAKDGRTIAVGEALDENLIGEHTQVINGMGMVLVPGFIDSHLHAMGAGIEQLSVNLGKTVSKEDFLLKLKDKADVTPKGEWICGSGYNELVWDQKDAPTKHDLDAITTDHPLLCSRLCHHVYVVNSKALEMAGITKDTIDPDGGIIGRDANGEPNGLLYENSAMELIHQVMPPFTEEQLIQAIEGVGKHLNSVGITSCIDANMTAAQMRAYFKAYKQGRLSYRSNMMFYLDKAWGDVDYHLKRIDDAVAVTGFGNEMLKLNGIKVTLDGIPATGTACMRQPYEHIPETCGYTTITAEEMQQIVLHASANNWQVGVHCCGDKTADIVIAAYIEAYKRYKNDARHYIIHHAVVQQDQFPLLKEYNILVTSQPALGLLMGEQMLIGDEMAGRYLYGKSYFDYGIIFGGSSDFPVVPCDPLLGMYAAITRLGADNRVWNTKEKLTPAQALIMWTKNSAYFSHDDELMGSIEVGNYADYVLLDTPILEVEPERIKNAKVLRTILGGRTMYEAQ